MKKVVFVGGTSFSGSTFFHLMLANDRRGFACGEFKSLIHPYRDQHFEPLCGCSDPDCTIWDRVSKAVNSNPHERIFEVEPEVDFLVDSSKDPFWIDEQSNRLAKRGIDVRHLLVWKSPLEFAHSAKRRQSFRNWDGWWVDYHQVYLSLFINARSARYRALATHPAQALRSACDYLEIPYFDGKERYWEKKNHALFGNYSARFHLLDRSEANDFLKDTFDPGRIELYRTIYYRPITDPDLRNHVAERVASSKTPRQIWRALIAISLSSETVATEKLQAIRLSRARLEWRRARHRVRREMQGRRFALWRAAAGVLSLRATD